MKSAYLVIAHGSRDREANQAFFGFLDQFRSACPGQWVEGSFLELAEPSIPQGIELCLGHGVSEIIILPMMFFPGRHVKKDIPDFIQKAKENHPEVDFHYARPVSEHPMLIALLNDQAKQVRGTS